MPFVDTGREVAADLLTGGSSFTPFDAANAHIGVGNSATAHADGQTDLQGTNIRKPMESTYPQVSGNAMTFRAVFGPSEANFAWQEWGVFNAASGGQMLNRMVESNGTKTVGATWQFTVTVEA